ncbi:hypothetical protein [Roseobacter litoralis]|uniref:Uncharacterized protein n=1 Tax=Roseobacter litoralis (strain ATCC 49566 / DSM 6996 / JCM 21268 / NBRC 15278 / OCh 149) TaxID=391595 RepID=F7ZB83_ROSLO|nr:hypothetical protein [Roseobacter litoralis]AEI93076.1 hypothetical protein RLO149_c010690 [Roseobacter litoralis Och 149]
MEKMTKHHSALERVGLFFGGLGFGYLTLLALGNYSGGGAAQAGIALFALCSLGGFYGAFVGKQSI